MASIARLPVFKLAVLPLALTSAFATPFAYAQRASSQPVVQNAAQTGSGTQADNTAMDSTTATDAHDAPKDETAKVSSTVALEPSW